MLCGYFAMVGTDVQTAESLAGDSGDDELVGQGFPWGTLGGGAAIFLAKGLNLNPLGAFVSQLGDALIGFGLFVYLGIFGIVVGAQLQRLGRGLALLGVLGSLVFFSLLQLLPAVGSWLTASLFKAQPVFSLPFLEYVQAWLSYQYFERFAGAETFGQSVSGYAGMFDDIEGFGDLASAILTFILNIIPDWAMYAVAGGASNPHLAYATFAISTLYWYVFSAFFMLGGWQWGREHDRSSAARVLARTFAQVGEEGEPELETPTPRYALLRHVQTRGPDETASKLLGYSQSVAQSGRPDRDQCETFDTEGTAEGAAAAARDAVDAGHVMVFGPLTAEELRGAAAVLRGAKIPTVAFADAPGLLGEGIYSLAWSLADEVKAVAAYAVRQGIGQFALFLPAALPEGDVHAMAASIKAAGGKVLTSETYGTDREANSRSLARLGRQMNERIGLVMIEPQVAVSVSRALAASEPKPVPPQLIGTSLWFSLEEEIDPALEGAWIAAPGGYDRSIGAADPANKPAAMHGGEILWLARLLDLVNAKDRASVRRKLERPEGFDLGSRVVFKSDGTTSRELVIFHFKNGFPERASASEAPASGKK